MKNTIILYSILSIFIASCASRKVNIDKADTVVKTDSTSVTKQEVVTTQNNHVSIVTDTDEVEIVPIDTTKHIEVNGKKYHNVKIRYKKTKKVLVDTTKIKVSKNDSQVVKTIKNKKENTFKKNIDKKESYTIYLWWLLILLLILLGYYTYRRINKTLF
jgi:ATP-dependent Zn protease